MRRCVHILTWLMLAGTAPNLFGQSQESNASIIADIRNAYEALDFAMAESRITSALAMYEQFTPRELGDIYVISALVQFSQGEPDIASNQLRQALQLVPSLNLDPGDTPPQLLTIFNELKQEQSNTIDEQATPADIRYLVLHDKRADAAVRSMILPGWGQLYKNERQKGIVLMGVWTLTAGGAVIASIQRTNAKDHYDSSSTQAETQQRFKSFSNWHKVRNNLMLGAATVWAYSYIDAILSQKQLTNRFVDGRDWQMNILPAKQAVHLQFSLQF